MKGIKLWLAAALFLAPLLLPAAARAQLGTRKEEQSFDYDPGAEKAPEMQKPMAETTYEDGEIVNHPIYGTIILYKYRWKNWLTRSLYLALINIALLAIILSLSRNEEYNLIVGYALCGVSLTISFWIFLCAVFLMMISSGAWIYVLPVAAVTGGAGWLVLMKIKRSDISLSELKESFQKMNAASAEDPRLASVQGAPGDWSNEDFIR